MAINVCRTNCHYGYGNIVYQCCTMKPIYYSCTTLFNCSTAMKCEESTCKMKCPVYYSCSTLFNCLVPMPCEKDC